MFVLYGTEHCVRPNDWLGEVCTCYSGLCSQR